MPEHQSEQTFFVESHRHRLGELYAQHILTLGNIAVEHTDRVSGLDDLDKLDRIVGITPRDVGRKLSESEAEIAKALKISHQDLLDILRDSDKGILKSILYESADRFIGPERALARHIRNVSDREAAEAIRAGMDHVRYRALKRDAADRFVGPERALNHLRHASDERVSAAMHAGVDEDIFKNLKRDAADRFVGPERALNHLRHASHDNVRAAMYASVDEDIFKNLKRDAADSFIGPERASKRNIGHVSHQKVAGKYTEYIEHKHGRKASTQGRDTGSRARQGHQRLREEELRRQAAESARRLWEEGERRKQAEARRQPPVDRRVTEIIARVTDPSSHKTLRLENPVNIAKVIKTVELLRAQDPSITDRQIYVKYRKAIEKQHVDPGLTRSFQILQNLMGGNIGGKLPF